MLTEPAEINSLNLEAEELKLGAHAQIPNLASWQKNLLEIRQDVSNIVGKMGISRK